MHVKSLDDPVSLKAKKKNNKTDLMSEWHEKKVNC